MPHGALRLVVLAGGLLVGVLTGGCGSLTGPDATPVPGAAATAARAVATAIPPSARVAASPGASPAPAVSPSAIASVVASPSRLQVSEAEIAELRSRIEQALSATDLPGIEALLLDRVSISTLDGGHVLDREAATAWLKEQAGSSMRVVRVDRNALSVSIGVATEGWTPRPPSTTAGRMTFNLHRYDALGRPDEERGDWKIDVISAD